MDFVQERYLKDKYIGDMNLIKGLGDGRICGAISSLSSNLIEKINVFYVDTDYITDEKFASFDDYVVAINNSGEVKPIQKMGFKTFIILKDGKLDKYFMDNLINNFTTTFALTSSGLLSWTAPKSSANQYYVCCLPIDANKYNKIKFTFSKTAKEGSNTNYPSVIYISTSQVNENKPPSFCQSFPNPNYNVPSSGGAKSGEFDISSYSDTIYLCFGTYSWFGSDNIYYPSTFNLHYLELT